MGAVEKRRASLPSSFRVTMASCPSEVSRGRNRRTSRSRAKSAASVPRRAAPVSIAQASRVRQQHRPRKRRDAAICSIRIGFARSPVVAMDRGRDGYRWGSRDHAASISRSAEAARSARPGSRVRAIEQLDLLAVDPCVGDVLASR
ncbi:MAG: hypothetical protein ABIY55_16760 [Kofleriaceae bacterium]